MKKINHPRLQFNKMRSSCQHQAWGSFHLLQKFSSVKNSSFHFLQEYINFHLIIDDKVCYCIKFYQPPSQSHCKFNSFIRNPELNLDKVANYILFLIVELGDLNAKSLNWCSNNKSYCEGAKIHTLASQIGLHQIIKNPTPMLDNSSFYIDLIFTSKLNFVAKSGVHISLHANCRHQIIFAKFNLKIYHLPPYERVVWYYQHAKTDHTKKAIYVFT